MQTYRESIPNHALVENEVDYWWIELENQEME